MKYPLDFYEQGQTNRLFNYKAFFINFVKGLIDSALILFICFYCFENISVGHNSVQEYYLHVTGMVSYGASILISNLKVLTVSHSMSPLHVTVMVGSYLLYVGSYIIYDVILKYTDVHNSFVI